MGNLHLVTGFAGESHVTAADHGSLFEAAIRGGQFVMAAGTNFAATLVTNNHIRISDGELVIQGRHVKMDPGDSVELTIENGVSGYMRSDLIVARYTRDIDTGIEACNLIVIKGTPVESAPVDPAYVTGSINAAGDNQHDMPLYRIILDGLTVAEPVALFDVQPSLENLARNLGLVYRGLTSEININSTSITQGIYRVNTQVNGISEGFFIQLQAIPGSMGIQLIISSSADQIWLRTCWLGTVNPWCQVGFRLSDTLPDGAVEGSVYLVKT